MVQRRGAVIWVGCVVVVVIGFVCRLHCKKKQGEEKREESLAPKMFGAGSALFFFLISRL